MCGCLIFSHAIFQCVNLTLETFEGCLVNKRWVVIGFVIVVTVFFLLFLLDPNLFSEFIKHFLQPSHITKLTGMLILLSLKIFKTIHDNTKIFDKKLLIELIINFDGDSIVERDLREFIHLLNIFIFGIYFYFVPIKMSNLLDKFCYFM